MRPNSSTKDVLRVISPSKPANAVKYRHSHNRSRHGRVSGLPRPLACIEVPNDFGEDVDQLVPRRRSSTGAEESTRVKLSRSFSLGCGELAALRRVPSRCRFRSDGSEPIQTYYPLHQGPSITVSSADGTTLCGDLESDNQRNAAAQSLFRAMKRQHAEEERRTLDGHMDKIFGAVELVLETKNTNAWNSVNVAHSGLEINSMHATIEGRDEEKRPNRTQRMKTKWNGWVKKVFNRVG